MTRDDKRRKPGGDPVEELAAGFGGLMNALGAAISEISERLDAGASGEVRRSFEVDTGKGPVRAEAGVRVRFADAAGRGEGAAARAYPRPINTPAPGADAAGAEAARSRRVRPLDFEILKDAETWRLTADIPGVEADEITLDVVDGRLVIETTGHRRYAGAADLPEGVARDDIGLSLRNGILELSCTPGGAAGA